MASSESGEKVYQFISDFSHKENLSGRVRAACITCRRKKIKCSGDSPCTTCREKGLVCEGLTPRKRPKRNLDASAVDQVPELTHAAPRSTALSRAHSRASSISSNKPVRPTGDLLKLKRGNSDDSGYASWRTEQSRSETPSYHEEQQFQQSSFVSTEDSTPVSPTGFQDWSFSGYGNKNNAAQSATNLDAAADLLEGQAMSLRQLATQRRSQAVEHANRLSAALSLQTDGLFSSSCPQPYQQTAMDDVSLMMGPRSATTAFAHSTESYSSGWDTCPASPVNYGFQQADMGPFAMDYTSAGPTQGQMLFGENVPSGAFDALTDNNPNTRQRSLPDNFFQNPNWTGYEQG